MTSLEIKQLLDEKYQEYCHSDFFIHTDPIQIPKLFEEKEDIEIAGFLAASLAWGQRPTIIKKCKELMQLLDYAPYDFVLHARESDFTRFEHFKHRTFNGYDCSYFLRSLAHIYRHEGGLENVFTTAWQIHGDMFEVLRHWYRIFTSGRAPGTPPHRVCRQRLSRQKSEYVYSLDGETRPQRYRFRTMERYPGLRPIDPFRSAYGPCKPRTRSAYP